MTKKPVARPHSRRVTVDEALRERPFVSDEEANTEERSWLVAPSKKNLTEGTRMLVGRWTMCNYKEKDYPRNYIPFRTLFNLNCTRPECG